MSVNLTTGIIPFTELFERVMTTARMDSFNNEDYAKGLVNDCYTRDLPRLNDWGPITTDSYLAMTACYTTGTVSVAAGGTAVTGVGTVWTSGMTAANGWKIKFAGNDNIYSFTYASGTTATISPALSGATAISGGSYSLFQDEYQLASDFNRLLRNGSIYVTTGGRQQGDPIKELARDGFREDYTPEPSDPIRRCMLTRVHATTGYQMLQVNPPPKTAKVYPYEYIKTYAPMKEYTTGTVATTQGSADIVGTGTSWSTNVSAGMYFRVDAVGKGDSSKWYQVSTVTSSTQITLSSVYEDSAESGAEYTICSAPTAFPSKFHQFILYDSVLKAVAAQDDPNTEMILTSRNDILNGLYKDYKGRRTNQQYSADDDGIRS
jgi:hypothetical protein